MIDAVSNCDRCPSFVSLCLLADHVEVITRAEDGEKLWSKMKEREKRFNDRKSIVAALREQNANLKFDKKTLQTEVDHLRYCFETFNIKLQDTGDKIHMPWLLSLLRDNVSLKERVAELEEIVRGEGYTVKAAEAEQDFRKKEIELSTEIEKVTFVIGMLKGQAQEGENFEVSVLLTKLEEALLVFGHGEHDEAHIDDIISAASSDITSLMSHDSFARRGIAPMMSNDSWSKPGCRVMSGLTEGCGLFHGGDEEVERVDEKKQDHNNDQEGVTKKGDESDNYDEIHFDNRNDSMSISRGISGFSTLPTDVETESEAPSKNRRSTLPKNVIVKGGDDLENWRKSLSPFSGSHATEVALGLLDH